MSRASGHCSACVVSLKGPSRSPLDTFPFGAFFEAERKGHTATNLVSGSVALQKEVAYPDNRPIHKRNQSRIVAANSLMPYIRMTWRRTCTQCPKHTLPSCECLHRENRVVALCIRVWNGLAVGWMSLADYVMCTILDAYRNGRMCFFKAEFYGLGRISRCERFMDNEEDEHTSGDSQCIDTNSVPPSGIRGSIIIG